YKDLELSQLGFRLSCHHGKVWVYDDVEFWASEDLNWFVKNERRIGSLDSMGISARVFEDLSEREKAGWVRVGSDVTYGGVYSMSPPKQNVFVAAPMNSISDSQYPKTRKRVTRLVKSLDGADVESAIIDKPTKNAFRTPAASLENALAGISQCSSLVLV